MDATDARDICNAEASNTTYIGIFIRNAIQSPGLYAYDWMPYCLSCKISNRLYRHVLFIIRARPSSTVPSVSLCEQSMWSPTSCGYIVSLTSASQPRVFQSFLDLTSSNICTELKVVQDLYQLISDGRHVRLICRIE